MSRHSKRKKKKSKSAIIIEGAGHEMKVNPPKILAHTRAKFGTKRAEEQRIAILLSKARKRGAKIKRRKKSK